MKNNIDPVFKKFIRKYIELHRHTYEYDYVAYIEDMIEFFKDISDKDIFLGVFNYIIEVEDENPLDHIDLDYLYNWFDSETALNILRNSGWMDKYFTLDRYKDEINNLGIVFSVFRDIKWEGDIPYLIVDDWGEFTTLYHSSDRNVVERVLGEDSADLFDVGHVDFIDEVWDNLDEKSLKHIKEYIKDNGFIGGELEYDEDSDGGGLSEDMLEDNELLGELINDEDMFYDLKGELSNFYRWTYNSAAENELFKSVSRDIVDLLGSKGEWDVIKSKKEGGSDKHILKFDISKIFMDILERYIECEGKLPEEEYGYFLEVLSTTLQCEGEMLETPDMGYFYPDSSTVSEHLNDYILGDL